MLPGSNLPILLLVPPSATPKATPGARGTLHTDTLCDRLTVIDLPIEGQISTTNILCIGQLRFIAQMKPLDALSTAQNADFLKCVILEKITINHLRRTKISYTFKQFLHIFFKTVHQKVLFFVCVVISSSRHFIMVKKENLYER